MKYASDAGVVAEGVGFEPTKASRPSGFQVRRFVLCPVGSSVKECVPVSLQPLPSSTWFLPDVPC